MYSNGLNRHFTKPCTTPEDFFIELGVGNGVCSSSLEFY